MTRRPNAAKTSLLVFIAEAQSQARSAMTRRPNAAKTSLLVFIAEAQSQARSAMTRSAGIATEGVILNGMAVKDPVNVHINTNH